MRGHQSVAESRVRRGQVPLLAQEVPHHDLEVHGIKRQGDTLELSTGLRNPKVFVIIPVDLRDVLKFLEVRLVYDQESTVATHGISWSKTESCPNCRRVRTWSSVDLGEIHPAVVGDETDDDGHHLSGTPAREPGTCQAAGEDRRRLSAVRPRARAAIENSFGAKARMKAKHERVMRDMEHKISRAIIDVAVEQKAGTIAIGDVRDIADGVDCGKVQNGRMSRWNHGKIRGYVTYKAEAEGITVKLVNEAFTTQTCPNCMHRHKPKGRNYRCPACGFQTHRDVVGQINILSRFTKGDVGLVPAPSIVKYRIPVRRVMRRCRDTGQERMPVARDCSEKPSGFSPCGVSREIAGGMPRAGGVASRPGPTHSRDRAGEAPEGRPNGRDRRASPGRSRPPPGRPACRSPGELRTGAAARTRFPRRAQQPGDTSPLAW